MKESNFQTLVKHHLTDKGAYVINIWGGGYQSSGIPDLIVCYKGIFIAFELKTDYNKATERQLWHIEAINNAGGFAIIFYYNKDWKEQINENLKKLSGITTESIRDLKKIILIPKRSASKTTIKR